MTAQMHPLKDALRSPFAWPGGYEKAIYLADGERICQACAIKNFRQIIKATRDNPADDWAFLTVDIYWEGPPQTCIECSRRLPSEYGDPEA